MDDHTVGHLLDQAKAKWLGQRSDVVHLQSQLSMARGRIARHEALLQRLLDDGDGSVSRKELENALAP